MKDQTLLALVAAGSLALGLGAVVAFSASDDAEVAETVVAETVVAEKATVTEPTVAKSHSFRSATDMQVDCRMALKSAANYGMKVGTWRVDNGPVLAANVKVKNAFGEWYKGVGVCVFEGGRLVDVEVN